MTYNNDGYRQRNSQGIPQMYIYIGIGLLVLIGIWFLMGFVRAGVEGYFALAAGILLILGNLRELIRSPFVGRENTALLNTLIGGSLITYFLGRGGFPPIGIVWYAIAIVLLLVSAPLMLGRASVYGAYVQQGRKALGTVKNVVGSYMRTH